MLLFSLFDDFGIGAFLFDSLFCRFKLSVLEELLKLSFKRFLLSSVFAALTASLAAAKTPKNITANIISVILLG